jgi:hypothetical protein
MRFWQWTHFGVQRMHNAAVRDGHWKLVSPASGNYVLNVPGRDLFGLDTQMLCSVENPEDSGVDLPPGFETHAEYRAFLLETAQAPRPETEDFAPLRPQLFDLENDPAESMDLSGEHPQIAERLRRALENWFDEVTPQAEAHRAADPYGVLAQRERE